MARKSRTDSIAAAVEVVGHANAEINPPEHVKLRDGDKAFWDSLVAARPKSAWTEADLEVAANLARCKADIERIQVEITEEGDTLINARGTPVMNPKHTLLEILSRRCMALSRMLHVHAEATQGESREQPKRKQLEEQLVQQSDDFIAPPLQLVK